MGRFSVDLVAKGAIHSPVDVFVKKREMAVHLHVELDIPVKTILVKKSPQLLCCVWPGDKNQHNITSTAVCRSVALRPSPHSLP